MSKIEEVKCPKCNKPLGNMHDHVYYGRESYCNCQFEPKPDSSRLFDVERLRAIEHIEDIITTAEGSHNERGDSCQTLYKMDIDALRIAHRLLKEDIKTASEKDKECQARVERIFNGIEALKEQEGIGGN